MAAKKKAAKELMIKVEENINTNDLIPTGSIEKPIIENKVSKADIINIITQGVKNSTRKELDDATRKQEDAENELHINFTNKIKERVLKEINIKNLEIHENNISHNNQYLSCTIHIPVLNEKYTIKDHIHFELSKEEKEEAEKLSKNIKEAIKQRQRIENLMQNACSKDAIKAQIDSAVIAKTTDGDKFMNNINDHIEALSKAITGEIKLVTG